MSSRWTMLPASDSLVTDQWAIRSPLVGSAAWPGLATMTSPTAATATAPTAATIRRASRFIRFLPSDTGGHDDRLRESSWTQHSALHHMSGQTVAHDGGTRRPLVPDRRRSARILSPT